MESTVLVKAFRLLEAMAAERSDKSLAELAQLAHLTKPTAHRILKSLADLGYVNHAGGGIYRLGDRLLRIVLGRDQERLIAAARSILADLRETTGETVNLGILQDRRIVYLLSLESSYPLRRVAVGQEMHPFQCTALGRAIAAHLPAAQLERLLASEFDRRTPHTVVDARALKKLLALTKARGYSIEEDETDPGVTCVGAPVFHEDRVVAALSVSAPSSRANTAAKIEWARHVRDAAARLSSDISRKEPVLA
jgi:DNA-binding IclR family transcriptional regulator